MEQQKLFDEDLRHYIMSIREEPANAIFQGKKPHEFRRKFDIFEGKAKVFIYVTKPTGKIIGDMIIESPIRGNIETLCDLLENNSYDNESGLRKYLEGASMPSALPITSYNLYANPISLKELRDKFGRYHPPVSFTRIDLPKYEKLRDYLNNKK